MEELILDEDLHIKIISIDPLAIEVIPNGIHFLNKHEAELLVEFLNKYIENARENQ